MRALRPRGLELLGEAGFVRAIGVAAGFDGINRVADAIVGGLAGGWPKDQPVRLKDADDKALAGLMAKLSPGSKGQLVKLATAGGSKALEKYASQVAISLLII